ncbi:MAG: hypothetical protein ABIS47_04765 [Acidimicrobiales bacterium]
MPDLRSLTAAAEAVERTAAGVDADGARTQALLEAVPWTGPRCTRVVALGEAAVRQGQRQADAERALARALRELAGAVERELEALALLAARARRHLEDLLARAHGVAQAARQAADAARHTMAVVVDLMIGNPAGAVQAAHALVQQAEDIYRAIAQRLQGLPEDHDPAWRQLGQEILRWQPL